MIDDAMIREALSNTLETTSFEGLGKRIAGKVRDSYLINSERRVLIVTDRISAFDRVLGAIPFKGQVLNQLAAFWFDRTRDRAPNHVLSVPDPNIMVVSECEQLALEFIVRAYMTGVTPTSIWVNYSRGERMFCGNRLPEGLRKDEKLSHSILTPTTKHEEHDRNISRDAAIEEGLIDAETFDAASAMCFRLFSAGVEHAARQGLILVDTKYELGRVGGRLVVSDEIHTPDSSRYWYADGYNERFANAQPQRQLDKEYVREWLAREGFHGEGTPPVLPDSVRIEAAKRYIAAYEQITGRTFEPCVEPIDERIRKAVERIANAEGTF